jgi:hypothetical protein
MMNMGFRWAGMSSVIMSAESMSFLSRSMAGGFFVIWDSEKGCKDLDYVLVKRSKVHVGLRPGTTVAVNCFVVAKRNEVGVIHTKDGCGMCTAHGGTKDGLHVLKTIGPGLTQTRYYLRKDRPWNHSASPTDLDIIPTVLSFFWNLEPPHHKPPSESVLVSSPALSTFGVDGGNKEQNSVCVVLWLKKIFRVQATLVQTRWFKPPLLDLQMV